MLIIFDCDGVLIDSEILAAEVECRILNEAGLETTQEEFIEKYAGLPSADILEMAGQEMGIPVSDELKAALETQLARKLDKDLKPIAGVHEMLDQIDDPYCICSNSFSDYLEQHLSKFKFFDRFRPYIYSSREVGTFEAKPSPNVFLHAAKTLEVDPGSCLVIEDSTHGVEAAVAAGMRPIGFTGGSHSYPGHAESLMAAGAETTINRLSDVPATVAALKAWRLD